VLDLPAEVMACSKDGEILDMNAEAAILFGTDGGFSLLGANVLECHPESARVKLERMLKDQNTNAYYNTENGVTRFFYQAPWYQDGQYAGFIEISFEVPEQIPHYIRG
jgi:transcriptional regulator with PAS, ATPase and Fis domain